MRVRGRARCRAHVRGARGALCGRHTQVRASPMGTRVTFRDVCAENEHELRKLNSVIFPVRYVVRRGAARREARMICE